MLSGHLQPVQSSRSVSTTAFDVAKLGAYSDTRTKAGADLPGEKPLENPPLQTSNEDGVGWRTSEGEALHGLYGLYALKPSQQRFHPASVFERVSPSMIGAERWELLCQSFEAKGLTVPNIILLRNGKTVLAPSRMVLRATLETVYEHDGEYESTETPGEADVLESANTDDADPCLMLTEVAPAQEDSEGEGGNVRKRRLGRQGRISDSAESASSSSSTSWIASTPSMAHCTYFLLNAKRDPIADVLNSRGWSATKSSSSCTLLWSRSRLPLAVFSGLQRWQWVNQFPRLNALSSSRVLFQHLSRVQRLNASASTTATFTFLPITFALPAQKQQLRAVFVEDAKVDWLVRVLDGKKRTKTYVTKAWKSLSRERNAIVSRLSTSPLLLNDNNEHVQLHAFALLTSLHPLRVFVHEQALVRVGATYLDQSMHDFLVGFGDAVPRRVFRLVQTVAADTLRSLAERLVLNSATKQRPVGLGQCFALIRFEMELDTRLRPLLLEMRCCPLKNSSRPVCNTVLNRVLHDTLTVLGLDADCGGVHEGPKHSFVRALPTTTEHS